MINDIVLCSYFRLRVRPCRCSLGMRTSSQSMFLAVPATPFFLPFFPSSSSLITFQWLNGEDSSFILFCMCLLSVLWFEEYPGAGEEVFMIEAQGGLGSWSEAINEVWVYTAWHLCSMQYVDDEENEEGERGLPYIYFLLVYHSCLVLLSSLMCRVLVCVLVFSTCSAWRTSPCPRSSQSHFMMIVICCCSCLFEPLPLYFFLGEKCPFPHWFSCFPFPYLHFFYWYFLSFI